MAPYSYSPLNEQAKEIRVLTLSPSNFSEEINISLENKTLSIDNRPEFEALSYAWGSTDNPVEIKIGLHGNATINE
jgi:hypothetical protein